MRLIRDGENGWEGGMEVGEEGGRLLYSRYSVTTTENDSCIKLGSDESHFSVSVGWTKSQDGVHKPQPF